MSDAEIVDIDIPLAAWNILGAWRAFSHRTAIQQLLHPLSPQPRALGIKVASADQLYQLLARCTELEDHIYIEEVNGRRIATILLAVPLERGIRQIKLIERRPTNDDPLGVDHIDVLLPRGTDLLFLSVNLIRLGVTAEFDRNKSHCWISIRWEGYEFKLVDHDVWSVCATQAQAALKTLYP